MFWLLHRRLHRAGRGGPWTEKSSDDLCGGQEMPRGVVHASKEPVRGHLWALANSILVASRRWQVM